MVRSVDFRTVEGCGLGFLPIGTSINVTTPRFLADDIATLESVGFIRLADYNGSGDPIYSLTREGSDYAAQLPTVEVSTESPPKET